MYFIPPKAEKELCLEKKQNKELEEENDIVKNGCFLIKKEK